jgi:peptide deformylase
MAVLPIYVAPHPVLKKVADPVAGVTDELRKLMDDMVDTMYAARGIGLAAPQVGVSQRVVVMDTDQREEDEEADIAGARGTVRYFVNPEITWTSDDQNVYTEGCLSIPGLRGAVTRPLRISFTGLDADGAPVSGEAEGIVARVMQHETDHLDGLLYPMRMTDLSRFGFVEELARAQGNGQGHGQGNGPETKP